MVATFTSECEATDECTREVAERRKKRELVKG